MSDDALQEPEQDWDGKTFGEAAAEDQEQADKLVEETGDEGAAAEQFESSEDEVGQTPTS
ncbi:MAG: hypothetical protein K0R11_2362 [Acidimicrobiales bacterium]|jgi:hypothetical protein|nr:hypothetical protein [Acidimicrobiales bacterium]